MYGELAHDEQKSLYCSEEGGWFEFSKGIAYTEPSRNGELAAAVLSKISQVAVEEEGRLH